MFPVTNGVEVVGWRDDSQSSQFADMRSCCSDGRFKYSLIGERGATQDDEQGCEHQGADHESFAEKRFAGGQPGDTESEHDGGSCEATATRDGPCDECEPRIEFDGRCSVGCQQSDERPGEHRDDAPGWPKRPRRPGRVVFLVVLRCANQPGHQGAPCRVNRLTIRTRLRLRRPVRLAVMRIRERFGRGIRHRPCQRSGAAGPTLR